MSTFGRSNLDKPSNETVKTGTSIIIFSDQNAWNCPAQMATAVLQNTNDSHMVHDEKLARAQAPKLPSESYLVMLGILQDYLWIPN